jgi:hypothetical protein
MSSEGCAFQIYGGGPPERVVMIREEKRRTSSIYNLLYSTPVNSRLHRETVS